MPPIHKIPTKGLCVAYLASNRQPAPSRSALLLSTGRGPREAAALQGLTPQARADLTAAAWSLLAPREPLHFCVVCLGPWGEN